MSVFSLVQNYEISVWNNNHLSVFRHFKEWECGLTRSSFSLFPSALPCSARYVLFSPQIARSRLKIHRIVRFQGVTWVLVYRTEKYQKLKIEIEKMSKKLEKKKEAHGEGNMDRSRKRRIEAVIFALIAFQPKPTTSALRSSCTMWHVGEGLWYIKLLNSWAALVVGCLKCILYQHV